MFSWPLKLNKQQKKLRSLVAREAYFRFSALPASFSWFGITMLDNVDFLLPIILPCTEKLQQYERLGEKAEPTVSTCSKWLQLKHIKCELSPPVFHSREAKSCSGQSIYKRLRIQEAGCGDCFKSPPGMRQEKHKEAKHMTLSLKRFLLRNRSGHHFG